MQLTIDLDAPGRQSGDAMLRWSDNTNPLGYHPIPIFSVKSARPGPVAVLIAGTHGDEFEGPSAIYRLLGELDADAMTGQVICLPCLNAPALYAASRVTPLDGQNLNRAFPGDPLGGPTAMIANFLEAEILPRADLALDLHSGGKASFFSPCTLPTHTADTELYEKNLDLATTFGLPVIWRLGQANDSRSVNSAAERAGVPMIATELGGGGGVDPAITAAALDGLRRVLRRAGILKGEPDVEVKPRMVELADARDSLFAPASGIFDRCFEAGQDVSEGDLAGWFHVIAEPERPSVELRFAKSGFVLAHTCRGKVERGEILALITQEV